MSPPTQGPQPSTFVSQLSELRTALQPAEWEFRPDWPTNIGTRSAILASDEDGAAPAFYVNVPFDKAAELAVLLLNRAKAIATVIEAAERERQSAHAMRIAHDDPAHGWLKLEVEWDRDCDALAAALEALNVRS